MLRRFDFRQLFLADAVSQLGTQVSVLALPLVAVLTLDATRFEVGLLSACETAAFLLVGLPAGVWLDRVRRRPVLVAGDLGRALLLASVPLAWWTHRLTMPQLYLVALAAGVCTVFFDVAYQSYLPHLVVGEDLVAGNASLEAVHGVAQVGGPTVAGLLVQWLGAPVSVAVDALSYLGSALLLGRIRGPEPVPARPPDPHLRRDIATGLRFVLGNPLLRPIALCTGSANLFAAMTGTMLVVLLARVLRLPAGTIGLFFSVSSAGAVLGAFAAQPVARRLGFGRTIWLSMAVSAPFELVLPVMQRGWWLWAGAVGAGVGWVGAVVYNVTQLSFRQRLTPPAMLGRMNASMRFFVSGALPLGGLLGGLLGQYLGVRPALWIAAVGQSLVFLPTFRSPLRHLHAAPAPEPQPAVG